MHIPRWFFCFMVVLFSARASAADLQEAVIQLKDWQSKIISIRIRSFVTSVAETHALLRESGIQTARGEIDWIWEDSGRFREEMLAINDERPVIRDMRLADTKHYYSLGYLAENPASQTPARVTILENAIRFTSGPAMCQPLRALWHDENRTWLGSCLVDVNECETNDEGFLVVSGELLGVKGYAVQLDPQHGYLPKIVGSGADRFEVEEFRELNPGFWFPWKGTILSNGDMLQSWEVKSVDLNTELPDSLFVPPMGPETYVINTITGKQYWHGGKPPAHLLAAKAAAANPGMPSSNVNPLTGSPEQPASWSLWLVLLGLVLVSGGVWLRRRA